MKKLLPALIITAMAVLVYGAATTTVNRLSRGIQSTSGTTDYNGATLVTSVNPTNEFKIVADTVTFTAAATTASKTYSTAFLASPTLVIGTQDAYSLGWPFNTASSLSQTTINVTISSTTFTRASTVTGTADAIPCIWYGYTRTGTLN